ISAIKVVAANIVMDVLDRAIQVHGSLGMTDDTPLAALWRFSRMLRLADGPDEGHKMVLAQRELHRSLMRAAAGPTRWSSPGGSSTAVRSGPRRRRAASSPPSTRRGRSERRSRTD